MPFLPPPLLWTFGTVAAAFIAKLALREWQRVNEELERMAMARVEPQPQAVQRLRRDPVTGVYRPSADRRD